MEQFLSAKSDGKLPQNVAVLLNDIRDRTSQLTPAGSALLIAVEDAGVAKRIAHERSLQPLCMLAGENHIVVPYDKERAFRRALRQMGYAFPAGA